MNIIGVQNNTNKHVQNNYAAPASSSSAAPNDQSVATLVELVHKIGKKVDEGFDELRPEVVRLREQIDDNTEVMRAQQRPRDNAKMENPESVADS